MMTIVIFGVLILLMMIGIPIAVALGLTAMGVMYWMGGLDLIVMVSQRMYASTTSFPLLAIPFFFLAGVVPGVLMGLSLMVVISIVAMRGEFPQPERPANFKAALRITLAALPA